MKRCALLYLICLGLVVPPFVARATTLSVDISEPMVELTLGFTGTSLLVYGAMAEQSDVIMVAQGPMEPALIRRKERTAGLWVNRASMPFERAPVYYHIAATEGAFDRLPDSLKQMRHLGLDHILIKPGIEASEEKVTNFRNGLIRNRQRKGLYSREIIPIWRRGKQLFRAELWFPAHTPVGAYSIKTLLVRDGVVVEERTTPVFVRNTGIGQWIIRTAHHYPALYGIAAVLAAVLAGLLANWIFRRFERK